MLAAVTKPDLAVRRALDAPARLIRGGRSASNAATNAWQSLVEATRGRAGRDQLAPGRHPEGPGNWLDPINPEESWRLLAPRRFGRLGFTAHSGAQVILPVNYVVHDRTIVIRSGRGPKLDAAHRGDQVAFEVDEIDLDAHTGWSVSVTGRARWVRDANELATLVGIDLTAWAAGPRDELIVIEPSHVGGRRLTPPRPATDEA